MDEFESTANRRPPSFTSDDAALGFDIEELDDKEFNLPPVENPPTLESILNEVEDSVSDEEVLSHAGPFGACDSASVGSTDSRDRSSSSRADSGIMRHVVLRGVSAQLRSAAERVHSGKPTAMMRSKPCGGAWAASSSGSSTALSLHWASTGTAAGCSVDTPRAS